MLLFRNYKPLYLLLAYSEGQKKINMAFPLTMDLSIGNVTEEEVGKEEADYSHLPHFLSSLFATIMEDSIKQLRILVECNNELRIIKTRSDWHSLLCKKFGVVLPVVVDELENINVNELGCDMYKINKLDSDRKLITDLITNTYVDLALRKNFKRLENYVNGVVAYDAYKLTIEADEVKNKILRKELSKQLRQQRNHIKLVIYDTEVKIDSLKTQVEDSALYAETRSRYITNWQRARTEQHHETIHEKESVFTDSIEYYKTRTDHEQRVHSEVDMLMNICINETLKKVEDWMNKYDKDMEDIDLKIQIKKNDYQDMLERRTNLEETYEKHEVLMKEWIEFKTEREKEIKYRELMTKSAIMVQAWWRGLLVRRRLGPYKPKKKPGAGGKKK